MSLTIPPPTSFDSGTVLEAKDYAVSGSGASSIVGYLDLNYPAAEEEGKGGRRHKGLSRAECEEMVQRALALAVGRDSHSGAWFCLVKDVGVWGSRLAPEPLGSLTVFGFSFTSMHKFDLNL